LSCSSGSASAGNSDEVRCRPTVRRGLGQAPSEPVPSDGGWLGRARHARAIPAERRLFFEFLAHTGLRISEATGLRWENLDLGEQPRIRVREQHYKGERRPLKSGSARRDVPLSAGMRPRLLAHRRDSYRGDSAPVFASVSGRELYQANVSRDALKPAAETVGLGWVSFHTFRHTCASLLFEAGRNVKQVADWLGHADPSFTLRTMFT
jgi:integrase